MGDPAVPSLDVLLSSLVLKGADEAPFPQAPRNGKLRLIMVHLTVFKQGLGGNVWPDSLLIFM